MTDDRLRIVFVASEGVPYSKTGGLADVIGSLPQAIAALGHDVHLFLPYYAVTRKMKPPVENTGVRISIRMRDTLMKPTILKADGAKGVTVYFIRLDEYYNRPELYGIPSGDYPDNAERFMFFSRAVAAAVEALDLRPDVLHCHDWQTGLIPALVRHGPGDGYLAPAATVFTVHNLEFQGLFWHFDMEMTSLPWSTFTPEGLEFYDKISLIKAGLVYSDVVNTVSRKYSQEIQTKELGCGLDGVLRARTKDVFGILNGVDYRVWDPSSDGNLVAKYGPGNMADKKRCRADLLKSYGLHVPDDAPVLGMVTRLTRPKGLDLVIEAFERILRLNTGFVLLGNGMEEYHHKLEALARKHPERVGVHLGFKDKLAHKIEAGADIYLMPSLVEPCGLNQMYSLRYGTPPIVRGTGGLDDTITSFDPATGKGTGFKFRARKTKALLDGEEEAIRQEAQVLLAEVKKAVRLFADRKAWSRLVANGMACDFSWDVSAQKYVDLYEKAIARHAERSGRR
jgi:starch synthase